MIIDGYDVDVHREVENGSIYWTSFYRDTQTCIITYGKSIKEAIWMFRDAKKLLFDNSLLSTQDK